MELPISQQAWQAAVSLAAGVGLGLLYDGFRAFRWVTGGRHFLSDLLFCFLTCSGLFCLGMWAGDGQLRIFMAVCILLGSGGYCWAFSRFLVPVFCRVLKKSARGLRFLIRPLMAAQEKIKKFLKSRKNLFPKRNYWVKIKNTRSTVGMGIDQDPVEKEAQENEVQKGRYHYEIVDRGTGGLRTVQHHHDPR